jgi:hypothetical protein
MSDSAHESLVELLPWYVNGTLTSDERDAVEDHLGSCVECTDNVDMLSRVRRSIRNDSPAPLVPQPRPDILLSALDEAEQDTRRRMPWKWYAAAASVLAFFAAAWVTLQPEPTTDGTSSIYQTATSDDVDSSIRYVVELKFEPGTSPGNRDSSLASIGAVGAVVALGEGNFRVTLEPGTASLAQLERRIDAIESLPEISSARVVAVQLPVE